MPYWIAFDGDKVVGKYEWAERPTLPDGINLKKVSKEELTKTTVDLWHNEASSYG